VTSVARNPWQALILVSFGFVITSVAQAATSSPAETPIPSFPNEESSSIWRTLESPTPFQRDHIEFSTFVVPEFGVIVGGIKMNTPNAGTKIAYSYSQFLNQKIPGLSSSDVSTYQWTVQKHMMELGVRYTLLDYFNLDLSLGYRYIYSNASIVSASKTSEVYLKSNSEHISLNHSFGIRWPLTHHLFITSQFYRVSVPLSGTNRHEFRWKNNSDSTLQDPWEQHIQKRSEKIANSPNGHLLDVGLGIAF